MIPEKTINKVKDRLVKVYHPLEIYLFGSYAWGTPNEESDLDLLIVIDETNENRYKLLTKGHRALIDLDISKDILVYTKNEFLERAEDISTLGYQIKNKGKKIYAKA